MELFDKILKYCGIVLCAVVALVSLAASFCGFPWQIATFVVASIATMLIYRDLQNDDTYPLD